MGASSYDRRMTVIVVVWLGSCMAVFDATGYHKRQL
jgi:hypothetical protein